MNNEISGITSDILITDDYKKSVKYANSQTKNKLSLLAKVYGFMWAFKFNVNINPNFISEYINDRISNCHTSAFINLNASKIPLTIGGKK